MPMPPRPPHLPPAAALSHPSFPYPRPPPIIQPPGAHALPTPPLRAARRNKRGRAASGRAWRCAGRGPRASGRHKRKAIGDGRIAGWRVGDGARTQGAGRGQLEGGRTPCKVLVGRRRHTGEAHCPAGVPLDPLALTHVAFHPAGERVFTRVMYQLAQPRRHCRAAPRRRPTRAR